MEMKKLSPEESQTLRRTLEANALTGAPLKMDPLDTSFVIDEKQLEEDLINAIHSVPCHYLLEMPKEA